MIWLVVGLGGLLFRTIQLFFIKDVQTGLVWATKILTDPFHDIKLYHKAPLYLMRGELIDPRLRRRLERRGRPKRRRGAELTCSDVSGDRAPGTKIDARSSPSGCGA